MGAGIGHDGVVRGLIADVGGVLVHSRLLTTAERWADQLGKTVADILAAIYSGNDDAVLVGRVSEDEWWDLVRNRLGVDTAPLRAELETGEIWDGELMAVLRDVKPR